MRRLIAQHRGARLHRRGGIGELHAAQGQGRIRRGVEVTAVAVAHGGDCHQLVQRHQRCLGLLVTHCQAYRTGQWRDRPAAEHHGTDQRALGEDAIADQVNAPEHGDHRGQLGDQRYRVAGHVRQCLGLQTRSGHQRAEIFPATQHGAFGMGRLERLHAFDRFDQQAVFLRGFAQVFLHQPAQWQLDVGAQAEQHQHRAHGHKGELTADDEQHRHEQEAERQIRQGRQGSRGDEVANRLELAELVGERTGRGGLVLQSHFHQLTEQLRPQDQVSLLAGGVDQVPAVISAVMFAVALVSADT